MTKFLAVTRTSKETFVIWDNRSLQPHMPLSNTSLQSLVRLFEEVSSDAWLSSSSLPSSSLVRGTCEIEETAFY